VSITSRILRAGARGPACEGSAYLEVEPDLVLGHEATIALLIARLRKAGRHIYDPSRCFFAADHFVPPASVERAGILRKYLDFIEEEGIPTDQLFQGISHQLLIEDSRCRPGALIAGADSHTTMGGSLGAFSAGFGSTDILALLATGRVAIAIPDAVRVDFVGALPDVVTGKDLALEMMRLFGEGGGRYRALEFVDGTEKDDRGHGLHMSHRATVTNMAVDCGAKNGLFAPDETTRAYMLARDGEDPGPMAEWAPDDDYVERITIDVSTLSPLVARPGSPADVVPATDALGERVHQVFIGSCCGGRLTDLSEAADILRGRRIPPTVRLVVTPASQRVYREAIASGVVADLIDAGAMVTASACGACGGIDKGLLADGEVCVSTSNRNFRGRMGSNDARIYLGSARTAAASALFGRVADPREVV
jgi:3-isopropylmalate/(R)-2-methylmalate dehydratase large subunit